MEALHIYTLCNWYLSKTNCSSIGGGGLHSFRSVNCHKGRKLLVSHCHGHDHPQSPEEYLKWTWEKKTKMYFVKLYRSGDSFVFTLSSFLSCKRALVFFLLNPNRLMMPSSWSYEEQWQHNKWRQCMIMWHHGSGSCTCNCCCKHANKKPKNSKEKVSLRTDPLTPLTPPLPMFYQIQNSVQVISPSPLIKMK
jgi:hypothetical protein